MPVFETPEFVAYALGQSCALRGGKHPFDPLETERQLRPLRAYCEALSDDRVWEGICVAPESTLGDRAGPYAFRADDILAAYGGIARVVAECEDCPACAIRFQQAPPIAGCFGYLDLSTMEMVATQRDRVLLQPVIRDAVAREFLVTRPPWYGLWAESPLRPAQLGVHLEIANILSEPTGPLGLRMWCAALRSAIEHQLEMHVTLIPGGTVEGRRWTIVGHCSRCHGERIASDSRCAICGHTGRPQAARTRCARGNRPFQPLALLLGDLGVQAFLDRNFRDP